MERTSDIAISFIGCISNFILIANLWRIRVFAMLGRRVEPNDNCGSFHAFRQKLPFKPYFVPAPHSNNPKDGIKGPEKGAEDEPPYDGFFSWDFC